MPSDKTVKFSPAKVVGTPTLTLSPSLPTGLYFDQVTGKIFGSCTSTFPKTTYTLTASGSGYASTTIPFTLEIKEPQISFESFLKSRNAFQNNQMGSQISVDGNTAAVSLVDQSNTFGIFKADQAPFASLPINQTNLGGVWIFSRQNNTWVEDSFLKLPSSAFLGTLPNTSFAQKISLSNDTLAVSVSRIEYSLLVDPDIASSLFKTNSPKTTRSTIFLYRKTNGTWNLEETIQSPFTLLDDAFGAALKLQGDTLAVGAPLDPSGISSLVDGKGNMFSFDVAEPMSGAVYIYKRRNSRWFLQTKIKALNAKKFHQFGSEVDLFGSTLVVSAPGEASGSTRTLSGNISFANNLVNAGAVYVYNEVQTSWILTNYLKSPNYEFSSDRIWYTSFGDHISIFGNTIAVGSSTEKNSALIQRRRLRVLPPDPLENRGRIYIFKDRYNLSMTEFSLVQTLATTGSKGYENPTLEGSVLVASGLQIPVDFSQNSTYSQYTNCTLTPVGTDPNIIEGLYLLTSDTNTYKPKTNIIPSNFQTNVLNNSQLGSSGNTIALGTPMQSSSLRSNLNSAPLPCDLGRTNSGAVYLFRW